MIENFKYTDKELDTILKSIVILIDTREQENIHITNYFDKKKISYKSKALDQGDYSFYLPQNESLSIPRDLYFDKEIIIERKGSLDELANNLGKERARFEKELSTGPKTKVLLIENASYADIVNHNYRSEYSVKSYLGSLHTFWYRYNFPVFFISDVELSGTFIYAYFYYYLKEKLR